MYYAILLNEESRNKLSVFNEYKINFCHHVTIAYKPKNAVDEFFSPYIGEKIWMNVVSVHKNPIIQAARISILHSFIRRVDYGVTHCTMSAQEGIKPWYSNPMLLGDNTKRRISMRISGSLVKIE